MTTAAVEAAGTQSQSQLWEGLAGLVDRAERVLDLKAQGIHLVAAQRWRQLGRDVPDRVRADELRATLAAMTVGELLRRVRDAVEGPVLVMKGPEVAARYPRPQLRHFNDVDVLVPDAPRAQRALLAAGFEEISDPEPYRDIHHLRPLRWPTLPLAVEVHERPKWPEGLAPPSIGELLEAARPSATGVDGVLALPEPHHALVVAAHAWAHFPLHRLRDVVDVACVADGVDRGDLRSLARSWRIERVWDTTAAAVDALLFGHDLPLSLRTWARHLPRARERTVLENHLLRLMSPFWGYPPRQAVVHAARALLDDVRPQPGEGWRRKLGRTVAATRRAGVRVSEHDRALDR